MRFHGNYCGPGWSDGKSQSSVVSTMPGVDEFDESCRDHDRKYATSNLGADLSAADAEFFRANFGKGIKRSIAAGLVGGQGRIRDIRMKPKFRGQATDVADKLPQLATPTNTAALGALLGFGATELALDSLHIANERANQERGFDYVEIKGDEFEGDSGNPQLLHGTSITPTLANQRLRGTMPNRRGRTKLPSIESPAAQKNTAAARKRVAARRKAAKSGQSLNTLPAMQPPNSYSQPEYWTASHEVSEPGEHHCICRGVCHIGTPKTFSRAADYMSLLVPLSPSAWPGTPVGYESARWERFRIRKLVAYYMTESKTTVNGHVVMAYQRDPVNEIPEPAEAGFLARISSRDNTYIGPVWQSATLPVNVRTNKTFFCDSTVNRSIDECYQGMFSLFSNYNGTDNIGQVRFAYEIEFYTRNLEINLSNTPGQKYTYLTATLPTITANNLVALTSPSTDPATSGTDYYGVVGMVYPDVNGITVGTGATIANMWKWQGRGLTITKGAPIFIRYNGGLSNFEVFVNYAAAVAGDTLDASSKASVEQSTTTTGAGTFAGWVIWIGSDNLLLTT